VRGPLFFDSKKGIVRESFAHQGGKSVYSTGKNSDCRRRGERSNWDSGKERGWSKEQGAIALLFKRERKRKTATRQNRTGGMEGKIVGVGWGWNGKVGGLMTRGG